MKNRMIILLLFAITVNTAQLLAQDDTATASGSEPAPTEAQLTLDDLRAFTDVFNQIRQSYVNEVDDKTLLDAAIRGMLKELDPHSDYLPRNDYKYLEDNSRGRYSGIGIDVEAQNGRIVVRAIINDSPADQAGINPGDIITSVNGEAVKGRKLKDAINELSGDPGSELSLTVLTPGEKERDIELHRKYLQIPAITFRLLDDSYGYFSLSFFHRETAVQLEQALDSIKADGIVIQGLILDLRDNPGGVLQPAIALADGFLDEGLIVSTRGQNETMQLKFEAHPGQWLPDTPMIILVDRGSASASEVLAGALQDHGRALIVGERTFGKGTVQSVVPLRNGGGIKLTTALYYTPSGRSIQAEGIEPDIVLNTEDFADPDDTRLREADLDRHLSAEAARSPGANPTTSKQVDFPLDEALRVLREAGILQPPEDVSETASQEQDQ